MKNMIQINKDQPIDNIDPGYPTGLGKNDYPVRSTDDTAEEEDRDEERKGGTSGTDEGDTT